VTLPGVDSGRVKRVGEALSLVPSVAVDVVETSDPQYIAVKKLYSVHGEAVAALVVANALVSYRLTLPGEEYWSEFAAYFSARPLPGSAEELVEQMGTFLRRSRGNRRLVEQKVSRLRRAEHVLQRLLEYPQDYRDLEKLVHDLSAAYSGRGVEKTVVFAAKMLHYLHRAMGVEEYNADVIPIPIDRRMALLTYTSGIIDAPPEAIMTRLRDAAVEAWLAVSKESGIPAISLDAVIWLPAYRLETLLRRGTDYARDEYAKRIVNYTRGLVRWGVARRIAEEVIQRGLD